MTKLLIDIPEVPQGSKTCGECPHGGPGYCFRFEVYLGGRNTRCAACRAAEAAALELLRIKAEKDEEDKTWKG